MDLVLGGAGLSGIILRTLTGDPLGGAVRLVRLTFDDGPHIGCTPRVLDVLRRYDVKATFFTVGSMVDRHGHLLGRMIADGHRVGNHTWSHPDLTTISDAAIADEVLRTEAVIARYAPVDRILRAPFGRAGERVERIANGLGYRVIPYDCDPGNWGPPTPPHQWVSTALSHLRSAPSTCMVLHDIHQSTARDLKRFLRRARFLTNVVFEPPATL